MIFCNAKVIFPDCVKEGVNVRIENGLISGFITEAPRDAELIDLKGKYLCPAFVDMHTHGGYGGDFMDATKEAFNSVLRFHLENGTAHVLATSVTAPVQAITRFIEKARDYTEGEQKYANLLGVHLEGPFLSVKNKGAQKLECLLSPEKDSYQFILDNKDVVKTVTIAPELDKDGQMTKKLSENGIIVCGGHDDGIFPEFMPSVENGLKHLTHIFCAMSFIDFKDGKRNVGLREYGLINDSITAEMIADNKHIPPELAKLVIKCKGADKVALVSDSLRCAGMPMDNKLYKLGALDDNDTQLFKVSDGVAVLADGSRYAGSITPVSKMVKNLVSAGVDLAKAVRMGSLTPASILGLKGVGAIEIGNRADLCVLDQELNVDSVYINGEKRVANGKSL